MFITLRPCKKAGAYIPMHNNCGVDLILTTFPDGVTRWLCPKCKVKQYTRGMNKIMYSVERGVEND